MFRNSHFKSRARSFALLVSLGLLVLVMFLAMDEEDAGTAAHPVPDPAVIGEGMPHEADRLESPAALPPPVAGKRLTKGNPLDATRHSDFPEYERRMLRSADDLVVVEHPDGRRSLNLGGRFYHMSAVVVGADGIPRAQCVSSYREFERALKQIAKRGEPSNPPSNERRTDY